MIWDQFGAWRAARGCYSSLAGRNVPIGGFPGSLDHRLSSRRSPSCYIYCTYVSTCACGINLVSNVSYWLKPRLPLPPLFPLLLMHEQSVSSLSMCDLHGELQTPASCSSPFSRWHSFARRRSYPPHICRFHYNKLHEKRSCVCIRAVHEVECTLPRCFLFLSVFSTLTPSPNATLDEIFSSDHGPFPLSFPLRDSIHSFVTSISRASRKKGHRGSKLAAVIIPFFFFARFGVTILFIMVYHVHMNIL